MAFDTKILIAKIENFRQIANEGRISDVFFAALNTGNALMQRRIFNENRDVEGNSFGGYVGKQKYVTKSAFAKSLVGASKTTRDRIKKSSQEKLTPYQRKRANRGRQVDHKDLELEGELRRSIEVQILDEKTAAVQFNFEKAYLVATGQENQISNLRNGFPGTTKDNGVTVRIFAFNEQERDQTNNQVRLLLNQIFQPR